MTLTTPNATRTPTGSPVYSTSELPVYKGGGLSWRAAFALSVAFLGDSRTAQVVAGYMGATFADPKGLALSSSRCGPAVTGAGTGTLEFRASDGYLRWTAPGDTAGAWTVGRAGIIRLESATTDKWIDLYVRNYSANPVTDQTISVTVAGTYQKSWFGIGYLAWVMNGIRWPTNEVVSTGIPSSTSADLLEQMARIEEMAGGPGVDVVLLGTNDVGNGVAAATTAANLTQLFDARRALGRKLVILNDHARWGASAGVSMSAQQQLDHIALNAFLLSYAQAHPTDCIHVDTYAATYNSGASDRSPNSGLLSDNVHPDLNGAALIGDLVADAIEAKAGVGSVRVSGGSDNLIASIGGFSGTGGTAGTGASGSVATSWTVNRLLGDATITASKETRGDSGSWQVASWTSTSAGRVQVFSASQSLASLGLAVGDEIYAEFEVDASSLSGVYNIRTSVDHTGSSPAFVVYNTVASTTSNTYTNGRRVHRTPVFKIAAGTTALIVRVQVEHNAVSSGTIKVGSAAIVRA